MQTEDPRSVLYGSLILNILGYLLLVFTTLSWNPLVWPDWVRFILCLNLYLSFLINVRNYQSSQPKPKANHLKKGLH